MLLIQRLSLCLVCFYISHWECVAGFSFMAIGDWGGQPDRPYTTPQELSVAKEMALIAEKENVKFIVALGDNFYDDGVQNLEDHRFHDTYEDVYVGNSLNIPWYIVAGNHDHHRNVSAQIAYTQKSSRWIFPDYFYSKTFTISGIQVEIVMIDTVILCGNTGHDHHGNQPPGPEDVVTAEHYWKWIETQLASSTSDYLLVGGHYPVWSVGHHGPTNCLVDRLRPLLQKHDVTAYLCGHDHNLQHLKEEDSSVDYILTGAANLANTKRSHKHDVPKDASKFFWTSEHSRGGFSLFNVDGSKMSMKFVDGEGSTLYKMDMNPRKGAHHSNSVYDQL